MNDMSSSQTEDETYEQLNQRLNCERRKTDPCPPPAQTELGEYFAEVADFFDPPSPPTERLPQRPKNPHDFTRATVYNVARSDRKAIPLSSGCLDYFPDALKEVAKLSKIGNDKHNPGQPLHWAQAKSPDHADCILRHQVDVGQPDEDSGLDHAVAVAWRALAQLQMQCQARGASVPKGAK